MTEHFSDEPGTTPGTATAQDDSNCVEGERPLRADARRNRDRILQAAGKVFGESGSEAQMDDVARAAGVGVGTLYRHFPTKNALMVALVRRKLAMFRANLERALAEHDDAAGALIGVMVLNAESLEHDAATRYAMGAGLEIWDEVAEEQLPLITLTQELIDRGKKQGALRQDLDAADIPMLMCGVSTSIDRGFDWRRHLDLVIDSITAR